jgi:serine/threonine protein phosphatase PrpC
MSVFSRASFYYGKYSHRQRPFTPQHRCEATTPISLDTTAKKTPPATSMSAMRVHVSASGVTDPGRVENQNQDAFFLLHDAANEAMVLGVFDGHGRETGKDAALTAKAFFEAQFRSFTPAQYAQLEADPHGVFTQLFRSCHGMIKSVFRGIYEQRGYRVLEIDGSLVRKDRDDDDDDDDGICIRGGTCATVTVLLHGGRTILTANVGDSAALLGAREPMLSPNDVRTRTHAQTRNGVGINIPSKTTQATPTTTTPDGLTLRFRDEIKKESVVLTGNHSADCESEFLRVRRHSFGSPEAQVQFVYDCSHPSPTHSRSTRKQRSPIFNVSQRGLVHHNMVGDYYKNVRDEWATIVTTPVEAPFPDSLAFTRSLGDFHMHAYGVCDEPTVQEISLDAVLAGRAKRSPTATSPDKEEAKESEVEFFLVVASDGVWDNWKYEELLAFLVEHNSMAGSDREEPSPHSFRLWPSRPEPTAASKQPEHNHHQNRIDRLVTDLMEANIRRADHIFGDQADNMTAIVCRIQYHLA